MKAIRIHAPGGADVLRLEEVPTPEPKPGEIVVRIAAAGVNYIDTYHRSGLYPMALPATLGVEAAGTVTAVGQGVEGVSLGDGVAWTGVPGTYAEYAALPAERAVVVPDGVSLQDAATLMLQGMTAHYLACSTYALEPGDTCLVHAAAGGVGLLLVQIAKQRGARVIGTVSTDEKAQLARGAGADEVILYRDRDFVPDVRQLTDGRGVEVVYDSVGLNTFEKSLDCLARRGMLVLFGQSSGPVGPIDPQMLNRKGSVFLTRPSLAHYVATRRELLERAGDVMGWVRDGSLRLRIHAEYALEHASDAHRDLESRLTSGKLLLIPGT